MAGSNPPWSILILADIFLSFTVLYDFFLVLLLFLCSLCFLPIPGTPGAFPRPLPVVCGVVLGNDLRGRCLFSPLSLLFMFLAYLWHAWCLSHVEAIMVQVSQRYGNVAVRAESCVTATPTSESLPRPFGSICRRMDIASTQGAAHLSASQSIAAAKL